MPKLLKPLLMGDPLLLQKSETITDFDAAQEIIDDMLFTIQTIGERVGLAAPQVGILKRIVVFRLPKSLVNKRYISIFDEDHLELPWTAMINPAFKPLSEDKNIGWEGCVSVPGLLGKVERFTQIKYSYYDRAGNFVEREAKGFHARLIQHECDHLDGILFPMRVKDMREFGFEEAILCEY